MDFIITYCFYPISPNATKKFWNGIYFDNPRNATEINYIADTLKRINFENRNPLPEEEKQVGPEYITLRMLFGKYMENNNDKKEFVDFFKRHGKEKNIYKIFAKMWVIIRYQNNLMSSNDSENIEENIMNNYNRVSSYMHFLDFMCTGRTIPRSIILDTEAKGNFLRIIPNMMLICTLKASQRKESHYPLCTFNRVQESYEKIIKKVDTRYNNKKFIFICDTIKNTSELFFTNKKMYNISLCSLIEMLLAHKPDNNRYNIEETISKQFVNKLKFILYNKKSSIDLGKLSKELKLAYSIRSDIAHGNFETIDKTMEKLYSLYEYEHSAKGLDYISLDSALENLNCNMIEYIREILFYYLNDEKKLELIKEI